MMVFESPLSPGDGDFLAGRPLIRGQERPLLPVNRPSRVRHARNLQAGIQEGWGVDSRLKIAGMTKGPTSMIGTLDERCHHHE
jgi:hypothetical protein